MTLSPELSVLIPTWDRADLLVRAVASVLANEQTSLEVVVIDQHPDTVGGWALQHAGLLNGGRVHHIATPIQGEGRARNLGAAVAAGRYLACLDDDCETLPGWASTIVRAFYETAIDVLCAPLLELATRQASGFTPTWYPREEEVLTNAVRVRREQFGVSANLAVSRAAFDDIGGFDPAFGAGAPLGGADDIDFLYRAIVQGKVVRNARTPWVIHHGVRQTPREVRALGKRNWRGIGAWYMKHVRLGDRHMTREFARELVVQPACSVIESVNSRVRPRSLGRDLYLITGAARSITYAIDAQTMVYRI